MSVLHIELDQIQGGLRTSISGTLLENNVSIDEMEIKEKEVEMLFSSLFKFNLQQYMGRKFFVLFFIFLIFWGNLGGFIAYNYFMPNFDKSMIFLALFIFIPLFIVLFLHDNALRNYKKFFNTSLPSLVEHWESTNDYIYEYSGPIYNERSELVTYTEVTRAGNYEIRSLRTGRVNTEERYKTYITIKKITT